ncbi:MAG: SDR family oxidoreductase, partial [Planctomycetales bacterium]|nr:SDR family oxidoreductase [Planctomycetales bacterium]
RSTSDTTGLETLAGSLEWIEGDLAAAGSERALVAGCDAIVHSALYHPGGSFRGGEGDLLTFVETNVVGTLRLIETARSADVGRFVLISTCAVHEQILDDRPLDERHPCVPTTHYGAHKAALEQFVYSFGLGQGYPICAVRPTGVYGAAHPIENSKWFDLVATVVRGEQVVCRKGGKEVHAADVARAVELLLRADGIAGEVFNCYDRYTSHYEVATLAQQLAGASGPIEGGPTRPRHEIETGKLRALGMQFGGEQLLASTIEELVAGVQAH